mgnify:CR=1 FL=1
MERSHWILDIEHDLRLISERLHALEDHFDDDVALERIAAKLAALVTEVEAIKSRRDGNAER